MHVLAGGLGQGDSGAQGAFVFGRERTGLYTEELNLCHLHSTIPTAVQNPAINLAQSVMIFSYILYRESLNERKTTSYKPASHEAVESLYAHLGEALHKSGFIPRDDMETFLSRFRRILGRTVPEYQDLQTIHKIIQMLSGEKKQ